MPRRTVRVRTARRRTQHAVVRAGPPLFDHGVAVPSDSGAGEDAPSTGQDAGEDSASPRGDRRRARRGDRRRARRGDRRRGGCGERRCREDAEKTREKMAAPTPPTARARTPAAIRAQLREPGEIGGSPLNANTIATTATGGVGLTPMDGAGNNRFCDAGRSERPSATRPMSSASPTMHPFRGDGSDDSARAARVEQPSNVLNTVIVPLASQTTFAYQRAARPVRAVSDIVRPAGGNGGSTLGYTFTYATGSPATTVVAIPDSCIPGALPGGEYTLGSSSRVNGGTTLQPENDGLQCNIYAINLNPDPTPAAGRRLRSPARRAPRNYLVFFGATAS